MCDHPQAWLVVSQTQLYLNLSLSTLDRNCIKGEASLYSLTAITPRYLRKAAVMVNDTQMHSFYFISSPVLQIRILESCLSRVACQLSTLTTPLPLTAMERCSRELAGLVMRCQSCQLSRRRRVTQITQRTETDQPCFEEGAIINTLNSLLCYFVSVCFLLFVL